MTLGKKLAEMRYAKKLSAYGLYLGTGLNPSTIINWENEQATPNIRKLAKICKFYQIELGELMKDIDWREYDTSGENHGHKIQ